MMIALRSHLGHTLRELANVVDGNDGRTVTAAISSSGSRTSSETSDSPGHVLTDPRRPTTTPPEPIVGCARR